MEELQMSKAKLLIQNSKAVQAEYHQDAKLNQWIYDLAWEMLQRTLGTDSVFLPIDVRRVANTLGFIVSSDEFSDAEPNYITEDHNCLPIAQLKMRRKLFGKESESICGTIRIANYLSENSIRFSIAHELGHFVLRHQNPIGSSVILDACPGMYPLTDTEEMVADMFAQALLLPYNLFKKEREEYERDRTHWPLDFSKWIAYIRDKAQIPEYHAVIACQEIKKRNIAERMDKAEKFFKTQVESMAGDGSETVKKKFCAVAKALYAETVFNLEGWGFSGNQVADILFRNWEKNDTENLPQVRRDVVSILRDYQLGIEIEKGSRNDQAQGNVEISPEPIQECIVKALHRAGLSETGIVNVIGIDIQKVQEIVGNIH